MNSNPSSPRPVIVIGGGVSGLAAAHRLMELSPRRPFRLLEADSRLGGVLETQMEQGFQWEAAADGFHGADGARDLCCRIGLADEIIHAAPCDQPLQIVHHGKPVTSPLSILSGTPPSVRSMFATPLLSWRGKCRVFAERWVAAAHAADESCASFFTRRFGVEFYTRLIEPVVGGIYSADPSALSMQALLPRLREMEQRCGSLTAAFKQQPRQLPANAQRPSDGSPGAWTLRGGMSSLTAALTAKLPAGAIELAAPVHRLRSTRQCTWHIEYGSGRSLEAAAVVLATPAHRAARLLAEVSPEAARLLQHIAYASVAVVALGYNRAQICRPLNSPGLFVPANEPFELRSASITSLKYPGRAPANAVLIRASLGGDHHSSVIDQSDADLIQLVHDELTCLLKIEGEPQFARARRQMFAIPQYRIGHYDLISAVRQRLSEFPCLALAGNAYNGIGVPHCIAGGRQAAEQVYEALQATPVSSAPTGLEAWPAPTQEEPAHV